MNEGLWIIGDDGAPQYVLYDELDADVFDQLFRPVGGFCYSGDDFLRLKLPSVPYYLKDWLPKPGKMLIYGRGKAGKSFLALQLARCIGSGESFLNIPTTQGRVLYLQFEMGASILQQRMRDTGQDYSEVYVGTTFAMKLDTKSGREQLTSALSAVHPNVLILDPFYKLSQGEEDKSHDVREVFDALDTIIEVFDCSVVLFHHAGKELSRGGRGSSIFEDWPDAYIEAKGKDGNLKLTPKALRHAELPPSSIEATLVDYEFKRSDKERPASVEERVAKFVLQAERPVRAKEVLEAELGSARAVNKALSALTTSGVIMKKERGVYAPGL